VGIHIEAHPDVLGRGEAVQGRVLLTGGRVARNINEVRVALQEHHLVSTGKTTTVHFQTFGELVLGGDFVLQPGQGYECGFSFSITADGRLTSPRHMEGWSLFAHAGISLAKDPTCRYYLVVGPEPPIQAVDDALARLGFTAIGTTAKGPVVSLNRRPPRRWARYLDAIRLNCTARKGTVWILADVNWQERGLTDYLRAVARKDHTKHELRVPAADPSPDLERFFHDLRLPL
jgi:sporulation-control protein spo0M